MRNLFQISPVRKSIYFLASSFLFSACTTYYKNFSSCFSLTSIDQEIKYEVTTWETTDDPTIVMAVLPNEISQLMPGEIKSVIINKNGFETPAGYLNWGRDNLYRYELINGRLFIYWQMESSSTPVADQVIVIIKIGT